MSPADQWEDVQGHFLDHLDEINLSLRAAGLPILGVSAAKEKIDLVTPDSSPELVALEPAVKVDEVAADSLTNAEQNEEAGAETVPASLVVPQTG